MNNNYLSRSDTDCFKGLCAIMVVLCHLCARTGIGASIGLGPIYSALGYWGVSGFMFMSGYGLTCSLTKKPTIGGYLNTFIRNRVIPIYLLMVFLVIFYYVLKLVLSSEPPTIINLIQSFFFGYTVVSFGWYLQSIILIYLLFYVVATYVIMHNDSLPKKQLIMGVGIGLLLYICLCLSLDLDCTWYETAFCFLAGVIVSCYRKRITKMLSQRTTVYFALLFLLGLFVACFTLGCGPYLHGSFKIILKMLSSVLFCLSWGVIMRITSLVNPVTNFLGYLYLEIYIIQGAIYLFLRNKYWTLESEWLFFILGLLLVIGCARLIKPATSSFMILVKKNA